MKIKDSGVMDGTGLEQLMEQEAHKGTRPQNWQKAIGSSVTQLL